MSRIEEAMEKRSQAQAKARSGASTVAKVSRSDTVEASRPAGMPLQPSRAVRPAVRGNIDEHIVSFHRPRSGLTENFKQIRIVIQNMLPEGNDKIIMFTSSSGTEGKTTASLNFAAAVAQDISKRVIIVDADMREPKLHTLLGLKPQRGFGDLLTSDAPIESVVVTTAVPGLSAILCGEIPPNPAELIGTERTRQLFAELKEKYDCVVVDSPPVLPVVDTIHMAAFADGVVLIVEAARTGRKKIQRAVQLLNNANASVMGFLLNKGQTAVTDLYT